MRLSIIVINISSYKTIQTLKNVNDLHILHLQLSDRALLLSKIMYLSLAERLCLLWDHTYIYLFWQASLSLSPRITSFFGSTQSSLLISTNLHLSYLFFLPLYVLSFPTSAPNSLPTANSTQHNFIRFHKLFNFYVICIFIPISILHLLFLYLPSM